MHCTFCDRPSQAVWTLIAGPDDVAICDCCARLTQDVLAESDGPGNGGAVCSFCGAPDREVSVVVGSGERPAVICTSCSDVAVNVVRDQGQPIDHPWYLPLRQHTTGWILPPDGSPGPEGLLTLLQDRYADLRAEIDQRMPAGSDFEVWARIPVARAIDEVAFQTQTPIAWDAALALATHTVGVLRGMSEADPFEEALRLTLAAEEARRRGDLPIMSSVGSQALALLEPLVGAGHPRALPMMARVCNLCFVFDEAERCCRRALATLPIGLRAPVEIQLGLALAGQGRESDAREALSRGVAGAQGDASIRGHVANELALLAHLMTGLAKNERERNPGAAKQKLLAVRGIQRMLPTWAEVADLGARAAVVEGMLAEL